MPQIYRKCRVISIIPSNIIKDSDTVNSRISMRENTNIPNIAIQKTDNIKDSQIVLI